MNNSVNLECTFPEATFLLRLTDVLKDFYDQIEIQCTSTGWVSQNITETNAIITVLNLDAEFFEYYKCPMDVKLCISPKTLSTILKRLIPGKRKNIEPKLHIRYVPGSTELQYFFWGCCRQI